jgi:glutaredoxin
MRPRVTIYSRPGCHLCDDAKAAIEGLRGRAEFDLAEVNIDSDEELRRLYGEEVPVVTIDGRKAFKYYVEAEEFLKKLRARSPSG